MNFKATKYILPSTSTVGELRYMLCSNGLSPAQYINNTRFPNEVGPRCAPAPCRFRKKPQITVITSVGRHILQKTPEFLSPHIMYFLDCLA